MGKNSGALRNGLTLTVSIILLWSTGMGQTEKPLFDFARPTDAGEWVVINDGVMGGLSRSSMTVTGEGTALFAGTVSLENYGGFASTSTRPRPLDLEGYDGILVRVRGDGKQYEFRIRTGGRFDGIAYAYAFETRKDAWVTVRVPFAGCVPTFRGRTLTGVDPVSAELIQQVGFLISNKQEGAFRLEIDWISAYK